ncbi:hypothetical protein AMTRI_Chr05g61590 [Amborella trichopoda]
MEFFLNIFSCIFSELFHFISSIVSSLHIINPPTPKSMDFYDFTSKWIMQILQNYISDIAVWRSFIDAVIFYIYNGIFTHISSPLSLWKRFQYFLCSAITIITLQNLHLDLFSLSLSS